MKDFRVPGKMAGMRGSKVGCGNIVKGVQKEAGILRWKVVLMRNELVIRLLTRG
jgi:hypothetical protein